MGPSSTGIAPPLGVAASPVSCGGSVKVQHPAGLPIAGARAGAGARAPPPAPAPCSLRRACGSLRDRGPPWPRAAGEPVRSRRRVRARRGLVLGHRARIVRGQLLPFPLAVSRYHFGWRVVPRARRAHARSVAAPGVLIVRDARPSKATPCTARGCRRGARSGRAAAGRGPAPADKRPGRRGDGAPPLALDGDVLRVRLHHGRSDHAPRAAPSTGSPRWRRGAPDGRDEHRRDHRVGWLRPVRSQAAARRHYAVRGCRAVLHHLFTAGSGSTSISIGPRPPPSPRTHRANVGGALSGQISSRTSGGGRRRGARLFDWAHSYTWAFFGRAALVAAAMSSRSRKSRCDGRPPPPRSRPARACRPPGARPGRRTPALGSVSRRVGGEAPDKATVLRNPASSAPRRAGFPEVAGRSPGRRCRPRGCSAVGSRTTAPYRRRAGPLPVAPGPRRRRGPSDLPQRAVRRDHLLARRAPS
jgi:hypothetical protein